MRLSRKFLMLILILAVSPSIFAQAATPIDTGSTAWMLISTALVLLMVPGLAFFYGGLVRTKNVLGTMMHSFVAMGVITVVWVVCGYSIAFGKNILGGWIGWDPSYLFLSGIDSSVGSNGIPDVIFAMFQGKFAIITPALIAGAFAERINFKAYVIFIVLWSLFVYSPIAHWVWAADGFLFNLGAKGAIDFAGGTVVHISAGVSGLVAAIFIGRRTGGAKIPMTPSNISLTMIGISLLWVGWFGFNAGSNLTSNVGATQAFTATQVAAAAAAVVWLIIEVFHLGKATAIGFASGILAGLVAITPAAGVVTVSGALAIGGIAAIACYFAITLKNKLGYDDTLDAFGVHGVGGIVGALFLTFFIRESWMADAATKVPGWGVFNQLGVQATAIGLSIAYSAIVTFILLFVINKFIKVRSSKEDEMKGLDESYHGEKAYGMLHP